MAAPHSVKTIRLIQGDDIPMMIDNKTKMPMYYPTAYILSSRRPKVSFSTLELDIRNIMVLYAWALLRGIDIENRFLHGEFLSSGECSELVEWAGYYYKDIVKKIPKSNLLAKKKRKVTDLEKYMARQKKSKIKKVKNNKCIHRLLTIKNYLDWLAEKRLHNLKSSNIETYYRLSERREDIKEYLKDNSPISDSDDIFNMPKGISYEEEVFLFDVIAPDSPQNPWENAVVRKRNYLLIRLLFDLGIRRGEAFALRICDVDLQNNTIMIEKRKNDKKDTRRRRANQKTLPRKLLLSSELRGLIKEYILLYRKTLRNGDVIGLTHDFLLVSVIDGSPLSLGAAYSIFEPLKKIPGIPEDLTSHTGRRTWNDRFSALADKEKIEPEKEKMYRNYLMGWKKNSQMAQTYARRHILQKIEKYQRMKADEYFKENSRRNNNIFNQMDKFKGEDLDDVPF